MLCHFLGRLVADRDIKVGVRDCRGGFHDVPVTVVGFGDDFFGLAFGAGRYFVHLPENIFENGFLGIVHRSDLLRIIGIGGGFTAYTASTSGQTAREPDISSSS